MSKNVGFYKNVHFLMVYIICNKDPRRIVSIFFIISLSFFSDLFGGLRSCFFLPNANVCLVRARDDFLLPSSLIIVDI